MEWDLHGNEAKDGIRFSWNMWPTTRLESTRIVVPVGCLYTPLHRGEAPLPQLGYDPIRCHGCGSILNPFCSVEFHTKLWSCPLCLSRNQFPSHYAENITETNLPAELIPNCTTVEYELQTPGSGPPAFLFLIDTCVDEKELDELKDSIQQTLNFIPENAFVGLITFGTHVMVHELGFTECPKSYVFRGTKDFTAKRVQELLGITPTGVTQPLQPSQQVKGYQAPYQVSAFGKFLVPFSDCSFHIENILEDLQKDVWPLENGQRVARCTGVALSVAIGLLESSFPRQGARIMLFTGGPATVGPGMIVSRQKAETMRSHVDIQKQRAQYYKPALDHYTGLAARAAAASHTIDIFACSYDQVGFAEMKVCVEKTGGLIVLADSFGQSVFKESLRRVFKKFPDDIPIDGGQLQMGFAANIEVFTSREIKIAGLIGPCTSLNKKSPNVAETEIGYGGTNSWSIPGIDPSTTLAFYFEIPNSNQVPAAQTTHRKRFFQFVTRYQHANGRFRLRVTSVSGLWHADPNDYGPIAASFDQEAAAVLLARLAIHKLENGEEAGEIIRWVDRTLIRLCAKFARYTKDKYETFQLSPAFSIFPQFLFHLRRSQFLQIFNSSPDESAYYREVLRRENVTNSLIMIQPSLISYSLQGPPQPVLLDATSVRPDCILLLDTFFHVVIFHGETIIAWRSHGYQDLPEHIHFKQLLEAAPNDAQIIMDSRFPFPRYIVCEQNKSESRFLIAKLNPSVTHNTKDGTVGQPILTDDVSLRVFMEHLMKLSVQS